jgi:5-formyltetrahydrofolate cyclo-ligase
LADLEPVDLVVAGCVAASEDGARLGKGGGFSDLEFALAAVAGLVGRSALVATTVHELQLRPPGAIPVADHDIRLDLIATPERIIECARPTRRPAPGIHWDELTDEKIAAIPLLSRIRQAG